MKPPADLWEQMERHLQARKRELQRQFQITNPIKTEKIGEKWLLDLPKNAKLIRIVETKQERLRWGLSVITVDSKQRAKLNTLVDTSSRPILFSDREGARFLKLQLKLSLSGGQ